MTGRAAFCLFVCALSLCVWATSAHAESPQVYVTAKAAGPALELEALQIAALARAALLEAQGFAWEPADVRARGPHTEARAAQTRALRGFRRGRQAYLRLELEAAVGEFERALTDWEEARAVIDSPELIAETLMYLGASYVLSENAVRAAEVFTRYHVQFGAVAPNVGLFNPRVMEAWQAALNVLNTRAAGAIEVRVRPASAAVMVDGVPRGRGSVRIEGVRPGRHWVRASGLGSEGRSTQVVVESGRVGLVEFGEVEDSALLLDLSEHASRSEGARALAQALGVQGLGVIEVRRAKAEAGAGAAAGSADGAGSGELSLTLLGFEGETGHEQSPLELVVGTELGERARALRGLVALWLDRVLNDLHSPAAGGVASAEELPAPQFVQAGSTPTEARPARPRRWLVWGAVAVGAVAVGLTAGLLIARDDASPDSKGRQGGSLTLEF